MSAGKSSTVYRLPEDLTTRKGALIYQEGIWIACEVDGLMLDMSADKQYASLSARKWPL